MDALALLCHLSADGAGSLVRLRRAGYATLQDVLLGDEEELMEILDTGSRSVQRLLRQAEQLEDRMGEACAEPERRPALSAPVAPPRPAPGRRPSPLVCQLEVEPLVEETGEERSVSEGSAPGDRFAPQERSASESAPAERVRRSHGASRFWMPMRRADEQSDPGSPGPFA